MPEIDGAPITTSRTIVGPVAAAGKKLRGHGARLKSRSPSASIANCGLGPSPHPVRVHTGQRYWPRFGATRRPFVVRAAAHDGAALARRLDGAHEHVTITHKRLLDIRSDGQGRYFQFLGWSSRRYCTWALVVDVHERAGSLILPEWHLACHVMLPVQLLPDTARAPGAWLKLSADLSACSPGRLNLAGLLASSPAQIPAELVRRLA